MDLDPTHNIQFFFFSPVIYFREGLTKKPANYPHFVDKGGGPRMWISDGGGGSSHVDKKIP